MMGQGAGPELFLKVASDFSGTDAAERALLVAGARYFVGGNYPEAKAQFEKYLKEYPSGDYTDQARLGVAACFDAQGKSTEAIAAYKQIAAQREFDTAAAQAKLALARLYLAQGNVGQARDYYVQLARPEYGPIGSEADSRLRQLLLEHPELSATPLAPPDSAVPAPNPIKVD
jgi:TolA-binding protein